MPYWLYSLEYNRATLTDRFIKCTLLALGWSPFCFQDCILHGINSTWRWKHSSETLVYMTWYWNNAQSVIKQDATTLSWCLHQVLTSPSKCHSRNSYLMMFVQFSVVRFFRAIANCSLGFLFLADRSDSWCGLLLEGFASCALRYALLHAWLFELLLPSSKQSHPFNINKEFLPREQPLVGYFCFLHRSL